MRDYYEVLGVPRDAPAGDIKKAYRKMAMEFHPDRNSEPEAEDRFKEAAVAYKVLSEPDQRSRYDQFGHAGVSGSASQGFSGADDIFSAFGDLFGDFFGGQRRRGGQPRGADLQVELSISFTEAVHGVEKDLTITRREGCKTCDGSGAKEGSAPTRCTTCGGNGQVMHSQGFFMIQTTCPECRGAGTTISDPCNDCAGSGLKKKRSKLTASVPAGVDNGQTLRLAGKGESPPRGGPAGHLYVVLRVEDDERFIREGDSVLTVVPISYITAALGGEVEVPTLEDECEGTTTMTVEPGTQPGATAVRRGEGIARLTRRGGRGDHVVQYSVEIPKKLSSREKELLRELADEGGLELNKQKRGLFSRLKR